MTFIERLLKAILMMIEALANHSAPIEFKRIKIVCSTNVNNNIAFLQDIQITSSDNHYNILDEYITLPWL